MTCCWCHREDDPDVEVDDDVPYLCTVCAGLVAPLVEDEIEAASERYELSMRWIDRVFHYRAQDRLSHDPDECWWCSREGEKVDACVSYLTDDGWTLRYRCPVLCDVCDGLLILGQDDPAQTGRRAADAYLALHAAINAED
jgi:hypothetical protein